MAICIGGILSRETNASHGKSRKESCASTPSMFVTNHRFPPGFKLPICDRCWGALLCLSKDVLNSRLDNRRNTGESGAINGHDSTRDPKFQPAIEKPVRSEESLIADSTLNELV